MHIPNPEEGQPTQSPTEEFAKPLSASEALREMVRQQRETNRRLAQIERELLGEEGDRSRGLVFRLADVEQAVRAYRKLSWLVAGAVVVLVVTRVAQLVGKLPS